MYLIFHDKSDSLNNLEFSTEDLSSDWLKHGKNHYRKLVWLGCYICWWLNCDKYTNTLIKLLTIGWNFEKHRTLTNWKWVVVIIVVCYELIFFSIIHYFFGILWRTYFIISLQISQRYFCFKLFILYVNMLMQVSTLV